MRERVRFGVALECASVQERDGASVAAAPVGRQGSRAVEMQAAVRDPGGGFGAPAPLGRAPVRVSGAFAAAVSGSGHSLVAWVKLDRTGLRTRFRLVAARRAPGERFAPLEALTPWRRLGYAYAPVVAAGVDREGLATVVWARASTRERRDGNSLLEVATAPAGRPFGPARALAPVDTRFQRLSLAVAAGGAALLAHPSSDGVQLYERAAGAAAFGPARVLEPTRPLEDTSEPALALRDDGAALVAWRQDDGVRAMTRASAGSFTAAQDVAPGRDGSFFGSGRSSFFAHDDFDRAFVPRDEPNIGLRAALSDTGRVVLAWTTTRPVADVPLAPMAAAGTLAGGFGAPATLGSPARSASGVAALLLPGGEPALAWVDNVSDRFGFANGGAETPLRGGRIHVARARGAPAAPVPPPRAVLRAPRVQRLFADEPARASLRCRAACDARVFIRRGAEVVAGDAASAPAGQRARLRLQEQPVYSERGLAGLGTVTVRARVSAPGSAASRTLSVRVRLVRRRVRPVPPILGGRAIRRGRTVVVTWRTAFPARDVFFTVRSAARFDLGAFGIVSGRSRTRFRVTLRPRRANALHRVVIIASDREGGHERKVAVRVVR